MRYGRSKKYVLRRSSKSKPRRWHRKLPKSSKFSDNRRKQAIQRDKAVTADTVYQNTPHGRRMWKLDRNRSDLVGYDTVYKRVKKLQKAVRENKVVFKRKPRYETIRGYTGLTGVEEHNILRYVRKHVNDPQKVDVKSLIDPELDYGENLAIIKAAVSPSFRDSVYYQ